MPSKMETPESAKTITVYVNGDQNFAGKKFVVNRKRTPTFDTLLGDVTSGVKAPFGAVRNLYTPVGGTRVLDLEGLSTGKTYVAGGLTKFQKVEYGIKPRPRRARSQDPRGGKYRDEKTLNPIAAQSRFQDFKDTNQKNILVYANGTPRVSFKFLLKSPRSQNLDLILDDVAAKISAKTGYAVRNLYTTQGKKIVTASVIEDGGTYVATGNERFKSAAYGISTAPSSTVQERQPRNRQVKLKPVRVASKDRKPTKPVDKTEEKLQKVSKVHRQANPLPPIGVATVYKQSDNEPLGEDEVPEEEDLKTDLPIEQQKLEEVDNETVQSDAAEPVLETKPESPAAEITEKPVDDIVIEDLTKSEEINEAVVEDQTAKSSDLVETAEPVDDERIQPVNDENITEVKEVQETQNVPQPEVVTQAEEDDNKKEPLEGDTTEQDNKIEPVSEPSTSPVPIDVAEEEVPATDDQQGLSESEDVPTPVTTTSDDVTTTVTTTSDDVAEPVTTTTPVTTTLGDVAEPVTETAVIEEPESPVAELDNKQEPVDEPVAETVAAVTDDVVDTQESTEAVVDTPVTTEASVDTPSTTEETPVTVEESPVSTDDTPVTTEDIPATTDDTPATTETTPVSTEATPSITETTPATMEDTPAPTEDTPATTQDTPVTTEESPTTAEAVESSETKDESLPVEVTEPEVTEPEVTSNKPDIDSEVKLEKSISEVASNEPEVARSAESAPEPLNDSVVEQEPNLVQSDQSNLEEQIPDTINVTEALDTVRALSEEREAAPETREIISDHYVSEKASEVKNDTTVTPSDDTTTHQP